LKISENSSVRRFINPVLDISSQMMRRRLAEGINSR
jgi:hypothetical protein